MKTNIFTITLTIATALLVISCEDTRKSPPNTQVRDAFSSVLPTFFQLEGITTESIPYSPGTVKVNFVANISPTEDLYSIEREIKGRRVQASLIKPSVPAGTKIKLSGYLEATRGVGDWRLSEPILESVVSSSLNRIDSTSINRALRPFGFPRTSINGEILLVGSAEANDAIKLYEEEVEWHTSLSDLLSRNSTVSGQDSLSLNCPPNIDISGDTQWRLKGTEIYSSDSSICFAAIHAGLISAQDGGQVTVILLPGAEFYNGSIRNGVTSRRYRSFSQSFTFIGPTGQPLAELPQVRLIDWTDKGDDWIYKADVDSEWQFDCPPNGHFHNVWGTDIFKGNSSICTAAVHQGVINRENGGRVTVRVIPPQRDFAGSFRNGVMSNDYTDYFRGYFDRSFSFIN